MAKKLYIETHGCQMNEYDSSRMVDLLGEHQALEVTARAEDADVILLNTCSIRERAQDRVYSQLGRWRELKLANPDMVIAVGGCVASQEGAAIRDRAPYVDVVFGPQTLHRLPEMIDAARITKLPQVDVSFPEIEKFKISGIYRTGMAKYDDISVFCELHYLSQLLKYEANQCGGIDIMIKPGKDIIASSKSIEAYLDFPYFSTNVYELHGAMFAWIELQKKPIPLVLGLISLVAVMNIITILLILIVEKTHTIGILRTLGMSPKAILTVFLVRGTAIGAIGTALGGIAAFGITYLQQTYEIIKLKGEIYFLDALPITIVLNNYLLVLGISLAFSFIVTLLPALTALKIKPIKAINFR